MTDLVQLGFSANTAGLTRAQTELDKTTVAGGRLDKQSKLTERSLGLVGAAIAAVGVTASVREVIQYTDSWSNLNTQLRQVTSSEEQLLTVREQLLQVSRETRIDLDATVGLYSEMTRGTSDLNLSSDKLVEITKTLNNLFLAGGKPLSEMTGAIRQLNQGFASGVLRGDEFNSVAEGAPRIMDALSASLGKTRGELREFAATGGITSAVMVKALESYSGTAQQLANTVKQTFEQTMGLVSTNVTQFIGESELLNSSVDALGGSLLSLSQNIEATTYALGAAGAVIATAYGVKVTAAMGASITATYAKIKADGEAIISQRMLEVQTAKTTLTKLESAAAETNIALKIEAANASRLRSTIAAFDAEFALEMQRQRAQISETGRVQSGLRMSEINASRAIATNQLTASETALAAAVARTTAAETAAAVGKGRLGAATTAVTTATVAQTAASRALGAATSFLMGPWGILIAAVGLGAATFLTASDNIDEATASAEKHAKAISELETIYSKWNKTRLEDERNKLLERSNEILFERLEIESKIQKLSENATIQQGMETIVNPEVLNEINALQEELASLSDESANVDNGIGRVIKALDSLIVKKVESTDVINNSVDANGKLADSYNAQVLALQNQQLQLTMTTDEFEIYGAIQSAIAYGATPEMTASIQEQVKALQSQRNAIAATNLELEGLMGGDLFGFGSEEVEEQEKSLSSLTDEIDSFGGAWSRTGNVVVDAFGSMSDAMNDYGSRMESIGKIQDKLNSEFKAAGDDKEQLAKLDKLQIKLNQEMVSAELSGYQALASGAASMFSEKTAAAKAFGAINQVLAVAEIALSYQKMTASTTETGVVVANEATKQSANALTAITAAFAAPFPVGFVAGAAMIGIMAALVGGAFSGGGGGSYEMPEEGGTGTVLGDSSAQSASIANALEDFDDIQIDQLAELRGIRTALTGLSGGIERLASQFSQGLNFGDEGYSGQLGTIKSSANSPVMDIAKFAAAGAGLAKVYEAIGDPLFDAIVGGFSSTKKKLVDSGISFITQSIGEIFDSGTLGAEMYQVIEKTKKKFWGLSKSKSTSTETSDLDSAITQQMASIFGYIGDSVIGAIGVFGLNTEDQLRNTLNSFMIDIGEVSFLDKTGDEIQEELEAIFSQQADLISQYLMPAITEYQKVGEGAFETLQRVSQEQVIFNDAIERTGVSLKDLSAILQIDVAQSIIGLVGGAEQFSELANDFFSSFYSESEQLEYLRGSITDVFDQLGLSVSDSKSAFRDLVEGIDLTTEEGQKLYATLLQISPSMGEYLDALDDLANDKLSLQIELLDAQGKSEEALALSRQMELDAMDESLHGLQKAIWAQEDLNAEREKEIDALNELRSTLEDNVAFAEQQLELARKAEVERLNLIIDGAQDAYNATLSIINAQRNTYNALISELESGVSSAEIALNASLNAEMAKYDALIAQAQSSSSIELEAVNSIAAARLSALNEERSIVASIANTLGAVSKSITATEALAMARSGDFSRAGNISTGGSFANAEEASIAAAREAFALNEIGKLADAQLSDIDRTIAASETASQMQIEAINAASEIEVAALESQKLAIEEQVKASLGIDESILSLDVALAQYQAAQDALQAEIAKGTLEQLQSQEDAALAYYEQVKADTEAQIESLNSQVDALLNIDDSVSSVEDAIKILGQERNELAALDYENQLEQINAQYATIDLLADINDAVHDISAPPSEVPNYTDPSLVNEIKLLRQDLDNANAQIGENTKRTADSVRTLTYMREV